MPAASVGGPMRREWEPEDLVADWTLVEHDERELVAYKRGSTRLGFALMLKYFEIEGRFPATAGSCRRPRSATSPARSGSTRPSWPATSGPGARWSTTARRSAPRWDSAGSPRTTRASSRAGWPRRSPRRTHPTHPHVARTPTEPLTPKTTKPLLSRDFARPYNRNFGLSSTVRIIGPRREKRTFRK